MIQHLFRKFNRALSVVALLSLAACGGGGAGSSLTGTTTPTTGTTPTTTTSAYTISLSSEAGTVAAGASTVLTATVKDGTGALVTNAPVSFVFGSNLSGSTISSASATTANGAASVNYTAGALSGTDTLLATVTSPNGTMVSASTPITVTGGATVGSISIQTSTNQVGTNSTVGVQVIVFVKSATNNLLPNVPVTLTADQGNLLLPNPAVTGANGSLTATLTTQNVFKNGVINLTASAGGVSALPTVLTLSGTTININGSTTASTNVVTPYSLTLLDGNGTPINGQTLNINTTSGVVNLTSVITNASGQASFNLTPSASTTLTVASPTLNASSALNVAVNTTTAQFTTPTADYPDASALFNINAANPMVVHVTIAGAPAANASVALNTTRGTLSAPSVFTNAAGDATVSINSSTAGPATITASYSGITTTRQIVFTAPTATQTIVQASPTNLSINASSTITAQLLDSNNNVVVGKTVTFTTNDTSGGSLFPTSAVTNSIGIATTTFTAGSNTDNQFQITANDTADGVTGVTPYMSVANKTASIAIGTDNTIQTASPNYIKTYSIFVTDTNGAPIANQSINLALIPQQYAQGSWKLDLLKGWFQIGNSGNALSFAINNTSAPVTPPATTTTTGDVCTNNDANHNGVFQPQAPYLERTVTNNNGSGTPVIAPPAAVASFSPATPVTNAQGFATVTVTYPQSYAGWVNYNFSATVQVLGTANTNTINFWLPVAAADVAASNVSGPAGNPSPFGPNVAGSSLYPTNGANCTIVP
ncbi:MAG: Ig-like domain-containing protein [Halothiobacillaceae bacterium]|nr:Ig-like domain-containing protein [Halothiobacillaceae bacterium]